MFIPCRTDVGTYFQNVLRDVSSRVGIDRHLVVIKRGAIVVNENGKGVASSFFPRIPTAVDRILDQTLI